MLKSKESEDRTGEMGVIDDSDNLSHSEQLSQIDRYEGYVQIEKWVKFEGRGTVCVEFRFPNGETGTEMFDWPQSSFSDSEFGQLVKELGYSAETVDMIGEDQPLFPYKDGEFKLGSGNEISLLRHRKIGGALILLLFPIFLFISIADFYDGSYYGGPDKINDAFTIWTGFSGLVWGVGFALLFL